MSRFNKQRAAIAIGAVLMGANSTFATFHLMQVEQIVGGVNGDLTAQAIQLRMRTSGQNLVSQGEVCVADANDANPIRVGNMTTNVANGSSGARVLIASASFLNQTTPTTTADFTMSALIPMSYLSAGTLTFRADGVTPCTGTILWRVAWGGAGYTGSTACDLTNDPNGNVAPPFAGPLPSSTLQALKFNGIASATSNNSAADYSVTPGAATFTNNADQNFTLVTQTGACCDDGTGNCTESQTQSACQGGGGRYGGDNSTCSTINPPCVPPPNPDLPIGLQVVASGLASPLIVTNAGDDRLFIVDQNGQILVVQNGNLLPTPFLDISSKIIPLGSFYDERGLLGLAFHPDYLNNGKFYVRYSHPRASTGSEPCDLSGFDPGCHEEILAQYNVQGDPHTSNLADPNSEVILFRVDKPQFNHNAGQVMFGPDGYLYFSLGDGGGANDGLSDNPPTHGPNGNGQNMFAALGKMHRIDVDNPQNPLPYGIPADNPFADGVDGLPEIYASGMRNPFRFSFDDQPGGDNKLYLGEVGQDLFEEVDIVVNGGNYGWVIREGLHCFDPFDTLHPPASCAATGPLGEPLLDPVMEYVHPEGCVSDADCAPFGVTCNLSRGLCNNEGGLAIVGGFVYRGAAYPPLYGKYVFGDFSADFGPTGRLYYFDLTGPDTYVRKEFNVLPAGTTPGGNFSGPHLNQAFKGFGRDVNGELYVCASDSIGPAGTGGFVYRIVPPETGSFGATPRYLDVTPVAAGFPFGLMVKPDCPNATAKYVGTPDSNNTALLVDNPANAAFLTSEQWGTTVHVTGLDVIPLTTYQVMADYGTPGSPALSGATLSTTRRNGDVVDPFNPPSPTDQPDIRDVVAIIDGFRETPTALPNYRLDLVGGSSSLCLPQQVINISDVAAAVDAFKGVAYVCPDPCP